jgi:hypothetical protein
LAIAERPAAESDDPAGAIADRKHHTVAKVIERLTLYGLSSEQPGLDQQRIGKIGREATP